MEDENYPSTPSVDDDEEEEEDKGEDDAIPEPVILPPTRARARTEYRTHPYLTPYERVRILAERVRQLNAGATPVVYTVEQESIAIAKEELEANALPLGIRRTLPDGSYEDWHLRDLLI